MSLANGKAPRVAFGETVAELGRSNPRIVVLDGDLGSSTRADIFENAHPDRFFQMGIAEQNLLGAAAGMATVGFIPFVSTFACFAVARALDSIRVLIAPARLNVKIVGGYSGLLAGMTGKTHLMFDDMAVMRAMPKMTVVVPADEVETRLAVKAITDYDGPVYLRLTRQASPVLFDDTYRFEIGKVAVVRSGSDATVFATGTQTVRAFQAAELLAAEGIDLHVVHVPTLKPLDADGIVQAAHLTGFAITSEEGSILGGLGGAVAEVLGDRYPVPVKRHGLADIFGESGPDELLLEKFGLSITKTADAIRAFVRARRV